MPEAFLPMPAVMKMATELHFGMVCHGMRWAQVSTLRSTPWSLMVQMYTSVVRFKMPAAMRKQTASPIGMVIAGRHLRMVSTTL
jgi:hypothetical protein